MHSDTNTETGKWVFKDKKKGGKPLVWEKARQYQHNITSLESTIYRSLPTCCTESKATTTHCSALAADDKLQLIMLWTRGKHCVATDMPHTACHSLGVQPGRVNRCSFQFCPTGRDELPPCTTMDFSSSSKEEVLIFTAANAGLRLKQKKGRGGVGGGGIRS